MIKRVLTLTAAACTLVTLTACGSSTPPPSASPSSPTTAKCSYPPAGAAAKANKSPRTTPITTVTTVTISTNRGAVAITLDPTHAPCTVNSFVSLARQGYFDNTHCHRLTTSGIYVLQCGDPSGTGTGGPGYSFADELPQAAAPKSCDTGTCVYPTGTVAMANTGQPGTNGSQFFLVYQDSPLAYSYTIFGRMSASGVKVVQRIAAHGSSAPDAYNNTAPNESVTISKVTAK